MRQREQQMLYDRDFNKAAMWARLFFVFAPLGPAALIPQPWIDAYGELLLAAAIAVQVGCVAFLADPIAFRIADRFEKRRQRHNP